MQCLHPIRIKNETAQLQYRYGQFRDVPCGRCEACIDNKRKAWYFRLKQENKNSTNTYFITLTYAPEHLPRNSLGFPTFCKRDVQLFLKRFRFELSKQTDNEFFKARIRYFFIGEYGSKKGRPHYHGIVFNVPYGVDVFRTTYKCWKLGRISSSRCNDSRIGYCANYMYGKSEMMPETNIDETNAIPLLSSRKPGIGASYLTPEMIKWHIDNMVAYGQINDIKYALPEFYKQKIFDDKQRFKISQQNRLRQLEEAIEQAQKDYQIDRIHLGEKGYICQAEQRRQNYIRKFYIRVKKHNNSKFNCEDF